MFKSDDDRAVIPEALAKLVEQGSVEALLADDALVPGAEVIARWPSLKGFRAARTPEVDARLARRRDERRRYLETLGIMALRAADTLGWATMKELYPAGGDKVSEKASVDRLVAAGALKGDAAAANFGGQTAYARAAYPVPLANWFEKREPTKTPHGKDKFKGVVWDRPLQKWRVHDLQGITVGIFDDLELAARARDDHVFDPMSPCYA